MRLRVLMAACLFGAPVFGGGAWLSFSDPAIAADPLAAGALTTFQLGLWQRGKTEFTKLTVTAEGLVDGKRVSIPLTVEKLSAQAARAVFWKPPSEGTWALALEIHAEGFQNPNGREFVMAAAVKVGPDGVKEQLIPLNWSVGWLPDLIDSALTGSVPVLSPRNIYTWRVPE